MLKVNFTFFFNDFVTLYETNVRNLLLLDFTITTVSLYTLILPNVANFIFDPTLIAPLSKFINPSSYVLSNIFSTYHYSIPNVKLAYPEPFMASASFMHTDLWFIHILTYQYWLWFVFCFLIVFFFITFLTIVRWCILRVRPRRETRGVSRSKCGDLITACVPVSWATSIIVNESTDAIDYFDGFGTAEMVMGIRAYQWGWEYYYPRDLDLTYTARPSYSLFLGNSLKYYSTTFLTLNTNVLLRFYQAQNNDYTITPLSLLTTSNDSENIVSKINFKTSGLETLLESFAFKNVRQTTKCLPQIEFSLNITSNLFPMLQTFFSFENEINPITPLSAQLLTPTSRLTSTYMMNSVDVIGLGQWEKQNNLPFSVRISSLPHELFFNWLKPLKYDLTYNLLFSSLPYTNVNKIISSCHQTNYSGTRFSLFFNLQNLNVAITDRFVEKIFSETAANFYLNINHRNDFLANPWETTPSLRSSLIKSSAQSQNFISAPIISNLPFSSNQLTLKNASPIFTQLEEIINPAIFSYYWNKTGSLINISWRFILSSLLTHTYTFSAMPPFALYYDYEFLNWQVAPLFENLFWDHNNTQILSEEYANFERNFSRYLKPLREVRLFWYVNRNHFFSPLIKSVAHTNNGIYLDSFLPITYYPSFGYYNLAPLSWVATLDESYDFFKNSMLFHSFKILNNWTILNRSQMIFFNMFRSGVDFIYANDNNFFAQNNYFSIFTDLVLNPQIKQNNENFILRLPAKNMITQYNAIHKVFRARFDETRSLVTAIDLAKTKNKQPILGASRMKYEKLINKTAINFLTLNFNKLNFENFANPSLLLHQTFPAFDFPFLLSLKSDPARHMWIDWFGKWNFCDIQPSSSARYSIIGLPLLNKGFDFSPKDHDILNETENYFIRIARARKNFSSNWLTTTMLFFLKSTENQMSWISLIEKDIFFRLISIFSNEINFSGPVSFIFNFISALSSTTTATHFFFQPQQLNSIKNTPVMLLTDFLAKREFFFRLLLVNRNTPFLIPNEIRVSPTNSLINAFSLLSIFSVTDQTNFSCSFASHSYSLLWKDQYRPMRRGINSLLRLQATGAIAIPSEIRLQILASSKDVIHSWAVPSAGVKIDCVPGYSSHKIFIFLLSGIYWGQCMEICGRYHHWMPIVVYFMKRDMFVLWCSHFILYSRDNMASTKVATFFNYSAQPISYGLNSWLSEL